MLILLFSITSVTLFNTVHCWQLKIKNDSMPSQCNLHRLANKTPTLLSCCEHLERKFPWTDKTSYSGDAGLSQKWPTTSQRTKHPDYRAIYISNPTKSIRNSCVAPGSHTLTFKSAVHLLLSLYCAFRNYLFDISCPSKLHLVNITHFVPHDV